MNLALTLLCATAFTLSACAPDHDPVSADDLAILNAVFEEHCGTSNYVAVVSDLPPDAGSDTAGAPTQYILFEIDIMKRRRGNTRWPIGPLCPHVLVARDARIQAALKVNEGEPQKGNLFQRDFEGSPSLITVSLPVYSPDGNRAVVLIATECGPLCGDGWHLEMQRSGTGWKIANRERGWVS